MNDARLSRWIPLFAVAVLGAATLAGCGHSAAPPVETAKAVAGDLRVLSNRADLISGGDALVEVVGANLAGTRVRVGDRDVTDAFAVRANGRFMGLVTGLAEGPSELVAHLPGGRGYRLGVAGRPRSCRRSRSPAPIPARC